MNLEANLNLTLSKVVEEGRSLVPMFGPGYTGMQNLGNSCYMNSVVQMMFSFPEFLQRYNTLEHINSCVKCISADCELCQIHKLAVGLWSGEHS